jgi:hypothetical protein
VPLKARAGEDSLSKTSAKQIYPYLLRDLEIMRPNQVWERQSDSRAYSYIYAMVAITFDASLVAFVAVGLVWALT